MQAPPARLADTFGNASYATTFAAFSPLRLFSAIESNVTRVAFFLPGGGELPAVTSGFGAVFSDVDQQNGASASTSATRGREQHRGRVSSGRTANCSTGRKCRRLRARPPSPFFGIVFDDARIARVKIVAGDVAPGPNDGKKDIVVMDDFIYGSREVVR
mgnify:CR=1 FL=1